ncbi:Mycophenolic acid synthesis protein B [Metarhizium anisopliae]|nr:Mycophenolic acid synthesis protein B [Metarhizium anisopliae]
MSKPENASKRYGDTAVLMVEFMAHGPGEERTRQAIERMNQTPYLKRDSWGDGIEFYKDITGWALQYESQPMVPAAANKQTANELFALLLYYVPKPFRSFAQDCVGVLMGQRLGRVMMHPTPSPAAFAIVNGSLALRRLVLRHLALPRFAARREFTKKDGKSGRHHHLDYMVHPYYGMPTLRSRWGVQAWLTWALGGNVPGGKGGDKSEVGADKKQAFGKDEFGVWERKVEGSMPLGRPFAI